MKWQEMIGQTFKTLAVVRRASREETPWKSHSTPLLCKCSQCKKEVVLRKEDVEKGCVDCKIAAGEISGGRGHQSLKTGDRFGKLTVIEYDAPHKTASGKYVSYVKCKCDCGNMTSMRKDHLTGYKRGSDRDGYKYTVSCGCSQVSAGELYVRTMLQDLDATFEEQYSIEELSTGLKFDFAVFDSNGQLSYLIEYDGEQHFKAIEAWGGEEKLQIQKERDERKNIYCKEQGIPLIRIPYTVKLSDLTFDDISPSSRFQI